MTLIVIALHFVYRDEIPGDIAAQAPPPPVRDLLRPHWYVYPLYYYGGICCSDPIDWRWAFVDGGDIDLPQPRWWRFVGFCLMIPSW